MEESSLSRFEPVAWDLMYPARMILFVEDTDPLGYVRDLADPGQIILVMDEAGRPAGLLLEEMLGRLPNPASPIGPYLSDWAVRPVIIRAATPLWEIVQRMTDDPDVRWFVVRHRERIIGAISPRLYTVARQFQQPPSLGFVPLDRTILAWDLEGDIETQDKQDTDICLCCPHDPEECLTLAQAKARGQYNKTRRRAFCSHDPSATMKVTHDTKC
jgi:hypothetical protein